eukprot:TRINITY_DN1886_c0_g1_i3.p1 TRINITY_DN1886_c0_g1~~TRINITY_DN1886_c0_g1_i3.p1  ORF type:complete len:101 (-),score=19.64 TRINITY_DN1886_c0_g1_i3:172-474(-)
MSMYVRVKRAKQTIFLYVEPTDLVQEVKHKIASINKIPNIEDIRLIFQGANLEDARTLAELKVENDSVIFLVYRKEGSSEFEEVNVHKGDTQVDDSSEKH